jgi:hypothetical protein
MLGSRTDKIITLMVRITTNSSVIIAPIIIPRKTVDDDLVFIVRKPEKAGIRSQAKGYTTTPLFDERVA